MDFGYILLNTVIYGSCALIISEFFSYSKFLHFAVWSYIMVAGYILIFLRKFWLNITNIIMILALIFFFFGVNYLLLKVFPNAKKREQAWLIITLWVSILLENLWNYFYWASAVYTQYSGISNVSLIILLIWLFVVSFYFHKFSYIGKEFKAISEWWKIVHWLWINADYHIQMHSIFLFIIMLLIAYLIINTGSIRMQDGFYYMLKWIWIMMLVGLSRKEWLLLWALIYVLIEYFLFVKLWLPVMYKESLILLIIIFCLLYKPEWLFNWKNFRKV